MSNIKIFNSYYKPYVKNKRICLKHKKRLNREIRILKKDSRVLKGWKKRCRMRHLELREKDLELFKVLINYYKSRRKQVSKDDKNE